MHRIDAHLRNYVLKFSYIFAGIVLCIVLISEAVYVGWIWIQNTNLLHETMENKAYAIEVILKNHEQYLERIEAEDETLSRLLKKTLESSMVISDGEKLHYNDIPQEIHTSYSDIITQYDANTSTLRIDNFNVLKFTTTLDTKTFDIYVFSEYPYTPSWAWNKYATIALWALPGVVIFFFLWYGIVSLSVRPVRSTLAHLDEFVSDTSHELKTPLSIIHSSLTLAQKTKDYARAVRDSLTAIDRMNYTINGLLALATLTQRAFVTPVSIHLSDMSRDIMAWFESKIQEKDLHISTSTTNEWSIEAVPDHVMICLENLIKNAIKYAPKHSKIDISLKKNVFEIRNFGPVIPQNKLQSIFERFYRETWHEWHGIGLAIVQKIVDVYGWDIAVTSSEVDGTRFRLEM